MLPIAQSAHGACLCRMNLARRLPRSWAREVAARMQAKITSYIEVMALSPAQLTDDALLAEVKRLAQCERETIATLVAHLVEVERRDLYRAEGCSSMFTYCTEVLRYSEDAAVVRLQAARAVRLHPQILADSRGSRQRRPALERAPLAGPASHDGERTGAARDFAPQEQTRSRNPRPRAVSTPRCTRDSSQAAVEGHHDGDT